MNSLKKILLVDNESHLTAFVRLGLERTHRYVIEEENNSRRAVLTARKFRPDLIFLDVMMPGLDGGEIARQIHADVALRETPIVFLTAIVSEGEVEYGGIFGGYSFLAKPVKIIDVIRCATAILENEESNDLVVA